MSLNILYRGKVIYDSDLLDKENKTPLNRVKVFIEGITPSNEELFKQPRGATNENTISQQALDIVGKETYAWVMQPVMGSGSGARYNANTDILTVADTGDINDLNAQPPAESYAYINDGYQGGNNIGTAGVNITGRSYSPDNRSNAYKGMLARPGVGANVILSFLYGEREEPIIIGILPGKSDVISIEGVGINNEIYPNYPYAYSNLTERSEDG